MTKQNSAPAPASTGQEAPVTAQNITVRQRATMLSRSRRQTAASSSANTNLSSGPAGPAPTTSNVAPDASVSQPKSEAAGAPAPGTEPTQTVPAPLTAEPGGNQAAQTQPTPPVEPAVASLEPDPLAALEAASTDSGEGEPSGAEPGAKLPPEIQEILNQARTADGKTLNKAVISRLHEVLAQLQQEKAARTALEQKLVSQTAQPSPALTETAPEPAPEIDPSKVINAYSWHPSVQQIDGELAKIESWIAWADNNSDGGRIPTETGGEMEVSAEHVKRTRHDWEARRRALEGYRGALVVQLQQQDAQKRVQSRELASQVYPWMKDPTAPEFSEARQLLRERPALLNDPEWPLLVGDYITGRRLRGSGSKPAPTLAKPMVKPRGGTEPAPMVAAAAAAPARVSPLQKSIQELETEYRRTGSVKAREKLFALKRRLATEAA